VTRGEHVLDAVLTVLAEQGAGALSVRTVAATAGVSPAQVQYYYRTKNDLVRAAYDYAGTQFVADLETTEAATLRDILLQWLPLDERRERRARVWLAYAATAAVDPALATEAAAVDAGLRTRLTAADLTDDEAAQLLALLDGVTLHCLVLPMAARQALVDRTLAPFLARLTE
jgi:AcrR family transcriptional regulator